VKAICEQYPYVNEQDVGLQTDKRLRVLVYTTLFPNAINPLGGNFVLERMRYLLKFADISVVAPVPYFPSWIPFNRTWMRWARVPKSEHFAGFYAEHPRYFVFPKVGMATHGLSMFAGTFRQVRERLKETDYDLIDAHYVYPDGFAAAMIAGILKKPLVVSARGSDINVISQFSVIRPLVRQVLQRANGLIAVSHALKESMVRIGCRRDNLAVIGNGVDPQKFKPRSQVAMRQELGLRGDGPIIVTVGRLDENKGFHILVDAVARLRASGVNSTLLILGEGPRRSHLENQIREAGLQESVKLIGTVPHDELSCWYNAADVFCLASSREGCPNVVLEAMACGRPVVASRVGGIPELVVSPGLGTLVERSPAGFEQALRDAFRRQWDHDAIAAHARSHAWDDVSTRVMSVYFRAIANFHGTA
jgi:teichuronic acid biosynthesis glycosyltransferase TuaC